MPTMTAPKRREPNPLSAKQIMAIREARGMTQAEAAERVLVSQSVWSAWERGTKKPSRQSLLLLHLLAKKKL